MMKDTCCQTKSFALTGRIKRRNIPRALPWAKFYYPSGVWNVPPTWGNRVNTP